MAEGDPLMSPQAGRTNVGTRLRGRREEMGLSLDEIAQRTRVPLRHLHAIEDGNYASLPSITYAMGFAKAYARTIGLDEVELGRELRQELGSTFEERPEYVPYEMADPTRVPSRGLAWAGLAVAVLIVLGVAVWFGSAMFRSGPAPAVATAPVPVGPVPPAAVPVPAAAVPASAEQVTLVAKDEVWLRVYDAKNETLLIKTMQPGERYDVPRAADRPMINIGRPDAVTVTINGSEVAPLGPPERAVKDVEISAAALRARGTPAAAPSPAAGNSAG